MISIIGGGPAGLLCAKEIAFNGGNVIVFEEHERIGYPSQCSGLVSKKGLDDLGVDYKEAVLNECSGARVFSPSGKMIELKRNQYQAAVLDRPKFDQLIAEEATAEGAQIITGERVTRKTGDILVGADGANSLIARSVGNKKEFIKAFQITGKLERDEDFVELHFGKWAPGFFAWVIPEGNNKCRIGIGVENGDPVTALRKFMKEKGINVKAEKQTGGLIPLYNNQPTTFPEKNTILIGDAADQVKATTGGGIAIGGFCARIAGEVIGKGLDLREYDELWKREFKKELSLHRKVHDSMAKIPENELDELFDLAISEGIPKLIEDYGDMDKVSTLAKHLLGKPRLLSKLAKYITLIPL
ncbi:MAG: NAD(P)/FAD-dependent oxidoreductase [Candidatus Diapherotrites archaeon]|nr:NAD(P)/FAD-dependent oxidoreductase [Candidatus Diapherotrites archaeon]